MRGGIIVSRHGENIHKRKDGRWEARYIPRGKTVYRSVYGKSYHEAKAKLREAIQTQPKTGPKKKMFKDVCLEWLRHIQIEVKPPTYANYLFQVERHIIPYFDKVSLKRLDEAMCESFIRDKALHGRLDKKGGLSLKTVHDLTVILSQIIGYAKEKGDITLEYDIVTKEPKTKKLDILSSEEHERLVQAILLRLNPLTLGFLIALYTGLRIGELCALTWYDIKFDDKLIRVTKTLQRIKNTENTGTKTKVIIGEPKSSLSYRDIPIPPFLYEILKEMRGASKAYILTGEAARFLEPRTYQAKFKNYLKEFGIRNINFHVLRHTFATRAISQGFELKSLSEVLGHARASFTLEKYVHSSIELKRVCMDKMTSPC